MHTRRVCCQSKSGAGMIRLVTGSTLLCYAVIGVLASLLSSDIEPTSGVVIHLLVFALPGALALRSGRRARNRLVKPAPAETSTTASPATPTARPSGAQKEAAIETQLKIVYARVEELASRIPRDSEWNRALGNFAKNLHAARRALTDDRDMRGSPISRSDIAAGLRRMCDSHSGPTSLSILGGIHGSRLRKEFEDIAERTSAIADVIMRSSPKLVVSASIDEFSEEWRAEWTTVCAMVPDQLRAALGDPQTSSSKREKVAWRLGELGALEFLTGIVAQCTPASAFAIKGIGWAGRGGNGDAMHHLETAIRSKDFNIMMPARDALRCIADGEGTPTSKGHPSQDMCVRAQAILSEGFTLKT